MKESGLGTRETKKKKKDYVKEEALSFSLVNKFAWNSNASKITIYTRDGKTYSPGILAHPEAIQFGKCAYPCDGRVSRRVACQQKCDGAFSSEGDGKPCAYRLEEIPTMLQTYSQIKADKSPFAHGVCDQFSAHSAAWTELVLSHTNWEKSLPKYVWALFVVDECQDDCLSRAKHFLQNFKQSFNIDLPVIGMHLTKRSSPFYLRTDITVN